MSTKELQVKLARSMSGWQKIEDASVASTGQIMSRTENPLIRLIMEIIQHDSLLHHRVQGFIADSIEGKSISLTPDELATVWDSVQQHIELERKMVAYVDETLGALRGKKLVVQEYLLDYLKRDETKHDALLSALEKIKGGMYPYG